MNTRTLSNRNCKEFGILIVQYVDNEISAEDREILLSHISNCSHCQKSMEEMKNIKEVSKEMKNKLFPDMAWDEYWRHLYNRLERGISWILISVGAIILLGIAVYHFILDVIGSFHLNAFEKFGILALTLGFVVLFVSVLREKIMVRKHDKYKEVIR
jgi:hypothetical protein